VIVRSDLDWPVSEVLDSDREPFATWVESELSGLNEDGAGCFGCGKRVA
jgi:hypothetical protein